jgi:hypothetical protein
MHKAVPNHDDPPSHGNGAEKPSWPKFPRQNCAERLEHCVGREEGEDDDRVARANLELKFLVETCNTGCGQIQSVHKRDDVENRQRRYDSKVTVAMVSIGEAKQTLCVDSVDTYMRRMIFCCSSYEYTSS